MRKRFLALGLVSVMMMSLTGCGDNSSATISNLNSIESLGSESSVTKSYSLSYSDEQDLIYAQVSDRTLLDLSTLDACTDNELQQAVAYMDNIDNAITGATLADQDLNTALESEEYATHDSISHYLADYILTFMEHTPYTWQRSKTIVRGIDSESRSIVVDVVYKTINHKKDVKPDSTIVKGDPDYAKKSEVRFERYINLLETQYTDPESPTLPQEWKTWRSIYGDEKDVIEEQNQKKVSERIYNTGIQQTYTGLIDNEAEKSGGTMTIRYILVPNYKLGINLGLTCQHLYITDYKLDKDITEGKQAFTEEGYATITDEVQELIHSYFQCIDESDLNGLYKLTKNFGGLDKYYEDVADSTYSKHNNFTLTLFSIQGTHITCGVTISSKERAKGSNMTYPVYTDRYYVELDLNGSQLQVSNLTLLSRNLEGEPAITTNSADTTGFVAGVEIDNEDKLAIEDLICKFGTIQLNSDTTSDDFGNVVDLSMAQSNLTALKTNMTSLKGVKRVTWLQNYQQGTSNYASVKCRELFQAKDNSIIEANVTYEFINKGGRWYVYNYDVNSSVKLDTTNLSTTGSLCLVSPGKVESYTSQVKGTTTSETDTTNSDISVTYDHKEYQPTRKSATSEKGLAKHSSADLEEVWGTYEDKIGISYNDALTKISELPVSSDVQTVVFTTLGSAVIMYANSADALYKSQSELDEDKNVVTQFFDACNSESSLSGVEGYEEIKSIINALIDNSKLAG